MEHMAPPDLDVHMKKKQRLALIQHPMWLLIKEDSKCLERTPPWGAPSIGEYSRRVERNLDSLERDPKAKVNYDVSGAELDKSGGREKAAPTG
jgi:hypothetical protein